MLTVVEIRPRTTIGRGFRKDLFELDRRVLASWMGRGYDDAKFQLGRVLDAARTRGGLVRSVNALAEGEAAVKEAELRRQTAMSRVGNGKTTL